MGRNPCGFLPEFNVFAFSAPDFAPRRTIVRLAGRNRTLQTILSLPEPRKLKTAQTYSDKVLWDTKKRRPTDNVVFSRSEENEKERT